MYIAPNTIIKILSGVPLDESYSHSIYFGDANSASGLIQHQTNFFAQFTKHTLTGQTYQRVKKGMMRVAVPAERLYDCNYLMYQNTGFGNKWFYAFITAIEYINNEVSEITFEIDDLQTWQFDFKLNYCFVDRMTPATDYIGENIIPEPVELGEMVYSLQNADDRYQHIGKEHDQTVYAVLAISNVSDRNVATSGKVYQRIYGAADLYVYDILKPDGTEVAALNQKIDEQIALGHPDSILAIYYIPSCAVNNTIPADHHVSQNFIPASYPVNFPHPVPSWTLDSWRPNNCKLYTYPYTFLNITNTSGDAMALRYEFFKDFTPTLMLTPSIVQPAGLYIKPLNYKFIRPFNDGPTWPERELLDSEFLDLTNYPVCSWNTDTYKAWVAQNSVPLAMKAVKTIGTAGLGILAAIATGGSAGMVAGAAAAGGLSIANNITSALQENYSASIAADIAKGNINSASLAVSQGRQGFHGGRMTLSYQYARMIDKYFDRFGYAQKRMMNPTKHNRPYWTYLKTIGCTLAGSMPKDAAVKICQIHDNGCLFYDPDSYMNMTGDNRALERGLDPSKVRNGYNPAVYPDP